MQVVDGSSDFGDGCMRFGWRRLGHRSEWPVGSSGHLQVRIFLISVSFSGATIQTEAGTTPDLMQQQLCRKEGASQSYKARKVRSNVVSEAGVGGQTQQSGVTVGPATANTPWSA